MKLYNEDFNKNTITAYCDCGCNNGVQFHFDLDKDESRVYLSFICDAGYKNSGSLFWAFLRRVRFAWEIIRGKQRCLHDIVLTNNDWAEFYNKLSKFDRKIKHNNIEANV